MLTHRVDGALGVGLLAKLLGGTRWLQVLLALQRTLQW